MCASLHELFKAASEMEKRSWEDIIMSLYNVCEAAKAQVDADQAEAEAELEERVGFNNSDNFRKHIFSRFKFFEPHIYDKHHTV